MTVKISNQKYDCRYEDCIEVGTKFAKLKANWAEIAEQEEEHPIRVMTRLASKKSAEEVEKDITADITLTEEHEPTAKNEGEAENSDITLEEAGEEQGAEANTVQDDLQEVQASTNSTAGSNRTRRILEKKERKRICQDEVG